MDKGAETEREKMRVGVIFGGRSGEHEVSLMSARSVISALDSDRYEIIMIGITRDGRWLAGDIPAALETGIDSAARPAALLPDPKSAGLLEFDLERAKRADLSQVTQLDVILPILHGPYGEDGTIQGLLELAGIPYAGAGVVGSAVGMDKAIFKYVMQAHEIPVLPWQLVLRSDWQRDPESIVQSIETSLDYPVFTKPANLGSSVGINKCSSRSELIRGLGQASRYDRRLIVEQAINAREFEVAVLGNDLPIASVIGEICPKREFYDYTAKYLIEPGSEEESELIIPAEISPDLAERIKKQAIRAFTSTDCAGMARVDFLMERETGKLFINELNTIPGFTRISMYPKLWEASGITYPELLNRLIDLAIERFKVKSSLKSSLEDTSKD